jgi:thymidylate kinase
LFITFEGGEGAGKTTLIEKIYEWLQRRSLPVLKTRAPGGTKAGEVIRAMLLNGQDLSLAKRTELFLFLADRAQHVEEVIVPALAQGKIVLCDRFNDSTLAYQGGARGFDEGLVRTLCSFATADLQPTLTLYLDLDPKIGLERRQKIGHAKDRIESEELTFHQKIREAFHAIAKKESHRFYLIDASQSPEHVFKQATAIIDAKHS